MIRNYDGLSREFLPADMLEYVLYVDFPPRKERLASKILNRLCILYSILLNK